jgi:hypothetical protein
VLCGLFQCCVDTTILGQFWVYRTKNVEMAKKIAAAEKEYSNKKGKPLTEELFT